MKNWIYSLVLLGAAVMFMGCAGPKQVSGQEFVSMLESGPHTMHHHELVGVQDGKVILKKSSRSVVSNKWKDSYYTTDVADLPEGWKKANIPASEQ